MGKDLHAKRRTSARTKQAPDRLVPLNGAPLRQSRKTRASTKPKYKFELKRGEPSCRNIAKTTGRVCGCGCGSWLGHWAAYDHQGTPRGATRGLRTCVVKGCKKPGTVGAHVRIRKLPNTSGSKVYIVPMCGTHNQPCNKAWMPFRGDVKLQDVARDRAVPTGD